MVKETANKILNSNLAKNLFGSKLISNASIKNATIVLLYHEVSNNPSTFHKIYNLNIPPSVFEEQIKAIKKIFNLISPKELLSGNYKKPACMITFDDGAAGYFENALPILLKHQVHSTVFLNMGPIINAEIFWAGLITYLCEFDKNFIDYIKKKRPNISSPYFLFILREDIQSYIDENKKEQIYQKARNYYGKFANRSHIEKYKDNLLVSFGNHLYNHFNCVSFSKDDICNAYLKNQTEIEKYPNATKCFSYPFGQANTCYNDCTTKMIKNLGAQAIFTANPNSFYPEDQIFHRLPMTKGIQAEKEFRTLLTITKIKQIAKSISVDFF